MFKTIFFSLCSKHQKFMEFKIKCLNNTPLIEAVIKDNKEITKLLLSKPGIDINHRNILIPNDSLHSE